MPLIIVGFIIAGFALVGVLAMAFGADSRDERFRI